MSSILYIETSTQVCSLALSVGEEIVFDRISLDGPSHAALVGVYAKEALEVLAALSPLSLDAVAVSSGPGSYTGLRIGVSLAKGICFASGAPLIAVPTLKLLAHQAIQTVGDKDNALYCPMIDARRMEVYDAVYDSNLEEIRPTQASIVEPETYTHYMEGRKVYFFGNGAAKCSSVIQNPNAAFVDGLYPSAKEMQPLAEALLKNRQFKDVAYFEPFYLKEFQATTPKRKVL